MTLRTDRLAVYTELQKLLPDTVNITFNEEETLRFGSLRLHTSPVPGVGVSTNSHEGRVWTQRLWATSSEGQVTFDTGHHFAWTDCLDDWPQGRGWAKRVAEAMLQSHLDRVETAEETASQGIQAQEKARTDADAAYDKTKAVLADLVALYPERYTVQPPDHFDSSVHVRLNSSGHVSIWIEIQRNPAGPAPLWITSRDRLPLGPASEVIEIVNLYADLEVRIGIQG